MLKPRKLLFELLGLATAMTSPAMAQKGEPAVDEARPSQPAGQLLPMAPTRRLKLNASTGTWLSLDVAPDGGRITFDLLGDLYSMPAGGGEATRITSGLPFDTQPTYAPDGRLIAFVSDRSGAENLWVARPDGSHLRQVTFGDDDTMLVSPAWAADSHSIYVSRYRADLTHYELWRYDLSGHGTLVVPVRADRSASRDTWRSSLGAVVSPDGRFLYFARHVGDSDLGAVGEWTIVRRSLTDGSETTIIALPEGPRHRDDPGAFFRPALSPDGRLLAYASRLDGQTELRVRDLVTGVDHRVAYPIERDQLQALATSDIEPRYAFSHDGRSIILARWGHFERVDLLGSGSSPIPFVAHVDIPIGPSTRTDIRDVGEPVRARLMMAPMASPDGHTLAFSALGRLYLMRLDGHSTPMEFVPGGDPAFQPSFSPDGSHLVWVRWSERRGGAVWTAPVDGSLPPKRLSELPAFYTYPVFSPDGRDIVVVRSGQTARLDTYMEYGKLRDAELVALPIEGGRLRTLTRGTIGSRPQFAGGRLYILADDGLDLVDPATGSRSLAARVVGPGWYFQDGPVNVDDVRMSPDGKWLLAQVAQQLHVVATPPRGGTVDLSNPRSAHRRLTSGGADYFEWSADGTTFGWSSGSTFHRRPLAAVRMVDGPDWTADALIREAKFPANVRLPFAGSAGTLLLHGARVLTMDARDRVLSNADILISHGRFTAVGPAGSLTVPAGTPVRDLTGLVVVPGFIDTHDHIATVRRDVLGLEEWGLRARLAYGVTTSFDPSTLSVDMLAYQDLLDAGLMVGPRLRQTGIALFSMQRITSLDDAIALVRHYRDDYGLHNIKEYRTGDRRVREWIAMACALLGMQPTTEGALSMKLDLTQIIDGFAGNEHALVASPLQDDVLGLLKTARTSYTTTLNITNGGPEGENWMIEADDPHDDPKIQRFWPRVASDQIFLKRPWWRLAEYRFPAIAADAAALQSRGGLVGIGSHGETPGIGFHWEMELHQLGGMSPAAILHAATIGSAETIGRASQLGSIEAGKAADLVVLAKDPLIDIRNARAVLQVMRDGVLYDGATLDRLWPTSSRLAPSWFSNAELETRWLPTPPPRSAATAPVISSVKSISEDAPVNIVTPNRPVTTGNAETTGRPPSGKDDLL